MVSDEWDDPWVQVDGTAEVIDAADDVEPFVEYFRNIAGEHSDWDEYRQAMRDQGKSLHPHHPRVLGPGRHRRLPAGVRPGLSSRPERHARCTTTAATRAPRVPRVRSPSVSP